MKRLTIVTLAVAIMFGLFISACEAGDSPQAPPSVSPFAGKKPVQAVPDRFYGYVPPPPVLHTWPGGYRIIRHELSNTLGEHISGHY